MKILPFVLLGKGQYAALGEALCADVKAWSQEWFAQPSPPEVSAASISMNDDGHRRSNGIRFTDSSGDHWAVCAIDKSDCVHLGSMMLCGQTISNQSLPAEGLVHGIIRLAFLDLIKRMLPSPGAAYEIQQDLVEVLLPKEAVRIGNEALYLSIDFDGAIVHVWLPLQSVLPRIAAELPTPSTNSGDLSKLENAVGSQQLSFSVIVGGAELTLGTISKLKVGDVIRLGKDLHDPLSLVFDRSPIQFDGYLGKQHARFAFCVESIQK